MNPSTLTDENAGFSAPESMTPAELGDSLARLVWESFSDFIAEGEADALMEGSDRPLVDGMPEERVAEELLIFFMWAHTRGVQLAFVNRVPEDLLREGLDALHRAVFEDMVLHGTPRVQLPVFEQRVSARYAELHEAARESDDQVGRVAAAHIIGIGASGNDSVARWLAERAVAVAGPLRDFLEEVELRD